MKSNAPKTVKDETADHDQSTWGYSLSSDDEGEPATTTSQPMDAAIEEEK